MENGNSRVKSIKPRSARSERIARGRPTLIAQALFGAAGPALSKFGFKRHELLTRWPIIVGTPLATLTLPERVVQTPDGATLVVRVDGGAGLEIQHMAPQIIDRINAFLGGRPVTRLKIVQGKVPRKAAPVRCAERTLSGEEEGQLARATQSVDPEELRQSLVALGRRILQRKPAGGKRSD